MNKLIISAVMVVLSSCSMYEQKQSCHKWYDYSGPVAASLGSVLIANKLTVKESSGGYRKTCDNFQMGSGSYGENGTGWTDPVCVDEQYTYTQISDPTTNKHPVANFSIDLVALGAIWIHGGEHLMPDRADSDCLE